MGKDHFIEATLQKCIEKAQLFFFFFLPLVFELFYLAQI